MLALGAESGSQGERVTVTVIGDSRDDATLGSRIQSLFDGRTQVELRTAERLAPAAILHPEHPGTAYVWILLRSDQHARIYVAARDETGKSARYLFRDIKVPGDLSELAQETLAQVAHSTLQALLAREQETPRRDLLSQLKNDEESSGSEASHRSEESTVVPAPANRKPLEPPVERDRQLAKSRSTGNAGRAYFLGLGHAAYTSNGQGWTQEPRASLSVEWKPGLVIRGTLSYLIPHEFDTRLSRVKLTGASGDLRVGWLFGERTGIRIGLAGGVGSSLIGWRGQPQESEFLGFSGRDRRDYAVGSLQGDAPVGPIRLALHFDLRVPFRATQYDATVGADTEPLVKSWLNPGFAIEMSIPLTRSSGNSHDGG